jgi:hypothetical protein
MCIAKGKSLHNGFLFLHNAILIEIIEMVSKHQVFEANCSADMAA